MNYFSLFELRDEIEPTSEIRITDAGSFYFTYKGRCFIQRVDSDIYEEFFTKGYNKMSRECLKEQEVVVVLNCVSLVNLTEVVAEVVLDLNFETITSIQVGVFDDWDLEEGLIDYDLHSSERVEIRVKGER